MATKKTYCSYNHKHTLSINVDEKIYLVNFVNNGSNNHFFSTVEKPLQEALELNPKYKVVYWLVEEKQIEDEITIPIKEEIKPIIADNLTKEIKEVKDVCDTKAAKAYFKENGIKCWVGAKEEEVKDIANKNNINFIDWE